MEANIVTTTELEDGIAAALYELGCDVDEIVPADNLVCDLGMDSTEIVELGIVLRERYGLAVRVDLRGAETAGDVVKKIQELLAA